MLVLHAAAVEGRRSRVVGLVFRNQIRIALVANGDAPPLLLQPLVVGVAVVGRVLELLQVVFPGDVALVQPVGHGGDERVDVVEERVGDGAAWIQNAIAVHRLVSAVRFQRREIDFFASQLIVVTTVDIEAVVLRLNRFLRSHLVESLEFVVHIDRSLHFLLDVKCDLRMLQGRETLTVHNLPSLFVLILQSSISAFSPSYTILYSTI